MKSTLIIGTVVLASACAGSSNEERATAEQRERAAEQRAEASENPEPIPSQFDKDGDGEVESADLKKSGVSDGAIDGLKSDGTIEGAPADESGATEPASDTEISAKIREKLADDDDLSLKAKNVRISTANGKVTLRGPVESADEKSKVESCAREVASNVDSRLQVAP
jgi:hypothetical protein